MVWLHVNSGHVVVRVKSPGEWGLADGGGGGGGGGGGRDGNGGEIVLRTYRN